MSTKQSPEINRFYPKDLTHSYRTVLKRARRHMNLKEKALSYLIHLSPLEALGELLSNTLARPTSLLFASAFGLISMLLNLVLNISSHTSNLTLAAIIAGYLLGFIVDLVKFIVKR